MESHDEERMMYKNKNFGNSSGDYSTKDLATGLRRNELISLFFYTTPGPRMLWQFGELGYDFSINRCENGTINTDCRLSRKPIRWDYLQNANRKRLYNITSSLIHLRQEYEVFKTKDFSGNLSNGVTRWMTLNGSDMDAVTLGNLNVVSSTVNINFPSAGKWYEYFSGSEIEVVGSSKSFDLKPGEYRLYTDSKLPEPLGGYIGTTGLEEVDATYFDFKIGPNPAAEQATVFYNLKNMSTVEINIFDLSGKLIQPVFAGRQQIGAQQISIDNLPATGMYWMQMVVDEKSTVLPFVVK